jgi:hypothetical protein
VDAFHPSILGMSIRRDSNVLDSKLTHVIVLFLRREFPPVVTAQSLDLGAEVPSCLSTSAMYDLIAVKASDLCLRNERWTLRE